jgi:hypothetical protein
VPRSRLSKTPSWITLGFILGALFVASLPRPNKEAAQPGALAEAPPVKLERPRLTEIEAVFADWGRGAVWQHDVTEVALWDTEKRAYSIFYEVVRNGDNFYFRSIPKFTRPVLTRGVNAQSPLQFTETEESRREWIEHGQFEPRSDPK